LNNNFPKQTLKLLSNGRMFSYEKFAYQVLHVVEKFEIDMSLHGYNNETHDTITMIPGSFEQAFTGLGNLLKYRRPGQKIGIRFVISRLSYKNIEGFLRKIYKYYPQIDRIILIFWEAEAKVVDNIHQLKVDFGDVVPQLEKSIDMFELFKDLRLYHFPLCVLPEELWRFAWITLPEDEVFYPDFCENCRVKDYCMGLQKTHAEYVGLDSLKPVEKKKKIVFSGNPHKPIEELKF